MALYVDKWGRKQARERYGGLDKPRMTPPTVENKPQRLADRNNMQASDYDNDVSGNSWLRKDGQGKPGYAPSFRSPAGKPGFEGARSIEQQGQALRTPRAYGKKG